VSFDQASGIERILAAAGGFMVGGIGSAFVGGTFGYKEMAKSLVPNMAVGLVLILGFRGNKPSNFNTCIIRYWFGAKSMDLKKV
jgi:hypothetical protein